MALNVIFKLWFNESIVLKRTYKYIVLLWIEIITRISETRLLNHLNGAVLDSISVFYWILLSPFEIPNTFKCVPVLFIRINVHDENTQFVYTVSNERTNLPEALQHMTIRNVLDTRFNIYNEMSSVVSTLDSLVRGFL